MIATTPHHSHTISVVLKQNATKSIQIEAVSNINDKDNVDYLVVNFIEGTGTPFKSFLKALKHYQSLLSH